MRYPVLVSALFVLTSAAFGQRLIVTAEGHHGAPPPEVMKDAVSVEVNRKPARVEEWVPLRGDEAGLQLYIVIDDGTDTDLGNQYGDLKNFIDGQPASTEIGLAYLQYGAARIEVPPTADHAKPAAALRIPLGLPGISASPYMGVSDLVKKWPAADARREMLLISSGSDPWSPPDPQNPYLLSAIADAQRAGIPVHSIYYAEFGHLGHSYWRINWGQNYLSELGDETGGEAYWPGSQTAISLAPFLKDLDQRLRNQYLLTVSAPEAKGGLQPVRVTTTTAGVSLVTASKINMAQ
jgi:hypothetical protein